MSTKTSYEDSEVLEEPFEGSSTGDFSFDDLITPTYYDEQTENPENIQEDSQSYEESNEETNEEGKHSYNMTIDPKIGNYVLLGIFASSGLLLVLIGFYFCYCDKAFSGNETDYDEKSN
jgi:hypothetical protein